MMARTATLALLAMTSACASTGRHASEACEPSVQGAPLQIRAEELAGSWRLTMVPTSGSKAGTRITVALDLGPGSGQQILTGSTALVADSIGASSVGDFSSTDTAAPGVALLDYTSSSGSRVVMLRFGSLANRTAEQRFDGSHLAAIVHSASPDGFQGTWRSGDGQNEVAAGHFCARRR